MAKWARAVASGTFWAGPWTGEGAQFGISMVLNDSAEPNTLAINAALPDFSATAGGGSEAVAGLGTIDYGSTALEGMPWHPDKQQAIIEAIKVFLNDRKAWQSANFRWNEIKLSAFNADGSVVNGATVCTLSPVVEGTSATMQLPPQVAIVQSLETGGRGSRNHGRFYVPLHNTSALTSTGILGGTTQSGLNTSTKLLCDTINALDKTLVAVVSKTHQTYSAINRYSVGDHADTQRRRARNVNETYATLNA